MSFAGYIMRLIFSLALVLLSFNPTGHSYFHWLSEALNAGGFGAEHAFPGVVLLIGWTILLRATFNSLGPIGLVLASLFIGTFVWLLTSFGLLQAESMVSITWIALISLGLLLSIGMSWSHIRRRLSGQVDVDDIDD